MMAATAEAVSKKDSSRLAGTRKQKKDRKTGHSNASTLQIADTGDANCDSNFSSEVQLSSHDTPEYVVVSLSNELRSVSLSSAKSSEATAEEDGGEHFSDPKSPPGMTDKSLSAAVEFGEHIFRAFESGLFSDVDVVVNFSSTDVLIRIPMHRLVLSQYSQFSEKLNDHPEEPLVFSAVDTGLNLETLKLALGFFYYPKLAMDRFCSALQAARTSESRELVETSASELVKLSPGISFLLSVYSAAKMFDVHELVEKSAALVETELFSLKNVVALAHLVELGSFDDWKSMYSPLSDPWADQLNHFLRVGLCEDRKSSLETAEFSFVLSHLPFNVLKKVLESPNLPLRSQKDRFSFAKRIVARRSGFRTSKCPTLRAIAPFEEHVLLAFTTSEKGVSVVRRVPKNMLNQPPTTLYLYDTDERKATPSSSGAPTVSTREGSLAQQPSTNIYEHFLAGGDVSKPLFSPVHHSHYSMQSSDVLRDDQSHQNLMLAGMRPTPQQELKQPPSASSDINRGSGFGASGPYPVPPHALFYAQAHPPPHPHHGHPLHHGGMPVYAAPASVNVHAVHDGSYAPRSFENTFTHKAATTAPPSPKSSQ